ncbi:hypothetical protein DFH07DRAFT_325234 [Mycena maculata]|uniref:Uncharacterized protein n=1 Tax=Mycena maculata TaxID=230809 RepID=A0AAD7KC33_9AGAR|nr:hypothetical protein DFH07DRAFT_325234 [Mycena maculata]
MLHDLNASPVRKGPRLELPYELEREIFEFAAYAYPKYAPQLALVTSYVQTWVEAVIYETIVLGATSRKQELFWRTFSSRPAAFFSKNIRVLHLATGISYTQARKIITICTNLYSLTCWSNPLTSTEEFGALLSPSLRRLSVNASTIWSPTGSFIAPDLTHPVFARLTHLEIVNPPSWFDWAPLLDEDALPNLTHLAFGDLEAEHSARMVPFFAAALASAAPRLEMLIAVSRSEHFLCALEMADLKDARLFCLPSYHHPFSPKEYWDGVARREIQFWNRQDVVVPKGI